MSNDSAPVSEGVAVKVGDVFVESWGYDQTNKDFYEVVGVTPSGKSVRLRAVASKVVEPDGVEGHFTYEHVVAVPGEFLSPRPGFEPNHRNGEVFTKRLGFYEFRGDPYVSVSLTDYSSGSLWDGKPEYVTALGFGH